MSDVIDLALIDDDEAILDALRHYLGRQNVRTSGFKIAKDFLVALDDREPFDCVFPTFACQVCPDLIWCSILIGGRMRDPSS